ncbi:regulatory protein, luxR family [Saccharicrinis carchari]|uniref:Regulatory protein, luxR family n=1 Tax=Saccharicrinis carchari TaxID=1168039 RepID=A0A521C4L3_SACCC|nr:LuxR C-terminal-related transcriptional regulator [Saccharicrinis carchari]SMO54426.1 regulatory protein, luxR family [Saccharicrinis carchari]
MIKQVTVILLLLHVCMLSWANSGILNFTKKEYRAASQNWSVAFDSNNIAYFGNGTGLLEFDGLAWHLHPSANNTIIRTVAKGDSNRIFTAGYRELGYWERDSYNTLQYQSLTSLVDSHFSSNEEFWNILVSGDKVYFQSFSGIYIYQAGTFRVIKPGGFINYATTSGGDVYVAIQDRGIYKVIENQLMPFVETAFFVNKNVRFFAESTKAGYFLLGTESNGLFIYNSLNGKITVYAAHLKNYFIENKINRGLLTPSGIVVLGTILNGIIAIDTDQQLVFAHNKDDGLQSNTVLGMAQDAEENIWLALDRGIDFVSFPDKKAYRIVPIEKLGAVYTAALFNGDLYIGTNQGLYKKSWPGHETDFTLIPNTQTQVWDCKLLGDRLFVGHNSGTFVIDDQSVKMISEQAGGYSIIPHPTQKDKLIQSTYAHLELYSYEKGAWEFSNTIKGFNNLIRFIEFDHQNNLWASHLYDGLYKLRLNSTLDSVVNVQAYTIHQQDATNKINARVFKIEGRLVFTTGDLLYTYNDLNDSIIPYTFLNEQLGEFTSSYRIVKGPDHRYWFISNSKIGCFEITPGNVRLIKEYPVRLFDNLLVPHHENLAVLDDKNVLVCLENGYALLNTDSSTGDDHIGKYSPWLKHVKIQNKNGKTRILPTQNDIVTLPYNFNNIQVQYAFPILNDEPVELQYKISGLQNNWSTLTDKSTLEINRIPQGDYRLSVKVVNLWDKSSQVHHLALRVKPPWYQSFPALVIYAAILLILAFVSKKITVRKVKLKESHAREEKEREIIKLRNENLMSELSFKSQQLANSTMGIIKKNEFLISLKKKIRHQKENLGNRYPDKYYQDLISKIDQNISGDDDWQLFDTNFQQAHKEFFTEMKKAYSNLTSNDLRLCAFLRMNLTSKEIAPLLGISVRGVENHRYRLRKKLGLASDENLTDYILMK